MTILRLRTYKATVLHRLSWKVFLISWEKKNNKTQWCQKHAETKIIDETFITVLKVAIWATFRAAGGKNVVIMIIFCFRRCCQIPTTSIVITRQCPKFKGDSSTVDSHRWGWEITSNNWCNYSSMSKYRYWFSYFRPSIQFGAIQLKMV